MKLRYKKLPSIYEGSISNSKQMKEKEEEKRQTTTQRNKEVQIV